MKYNLVAMLKEMWFVFCLLGWYLAYPQMQSYTVKKGDTMEGIAKIYRVSPSDILRKNPQIQSSIKPGILLVIPGNEVKYYNKQEPIGFKIHTVKPQETLFGLSQLYDLTIDDLKRYNFALYERSLQESEELTIPVYAQKKKMVEKGIFGQTKYVVKPKEGLWRIAQNHQTTQDVILKMNPEITESNLREGQEIWVPSTEKSTKINNTGQDVVLYAVEKAEGFYSLERKFGLTKAELIALNPELKDGIKADTQLWIPRTNFEHYRNSLVTNTTDYSENTNHLLASLSSPKNVQQIAFVLPFKVSDVGEIDRFITLKERLNNDKVTPLAADFYSGALIALDSLQQLGYHFQVSVFDSEASENKVRELANNPKLRKSQLIIGPFVPRVFNTLSKEINSNITLLAPLSNRNIELHSNVYQTLPTNELQQERMINFISQMYPNANILIMVDAKNNDIQQKLAQNFPFAKTISDVSETALTQALDVVNDNIVFLQSNDLAYVSNALQILHNIFLSSKSYKITLATTEKGNVYDNYNISNIQLSDLQFTYPTFNRYSEGSDAFSQKYLNTYGVLPNRYAIRGFDLTFDAVLRLAITSDFTEANTKIKETSHVENKFSYLKNISKGGGYENHGVYIVRYENLAIKDITP